MSPTPRSTAVSRVASKTNKLTSLAGQYQHSGSNNSHTRQCCRSLNSRRLCRISLNFLYNHLASFHKNGASMCVRHLQAPGCAWHDGLNASGHAAYTHLRLQAAKRASGGCQYRTALIFQHLVKYVFTVTKRGTLLNHVRCEKRNESHCRVNARHDIGMHSKRRKHAIKSTSICFKLSRHLFYMKTGFVYVAFSFNRLLIYVFYP